MERNFLTNLEVKIMTICLTIVPFIYGCHGFIVGIIERTIAPVMIGVALMIPFIIITCLNKGQIYRTKPICADRLKTNENTIRSNVILPEVTLSIPEKTNIHLMENSGLEPEKNGFNPKLSYFQSIANFGYGFFLRKQNQNCSSQNNLEQKDKISKLQ